jgi:hypothetical protein
MHSGTITFNNAITVGDFLIGYDPTRATNGRSGFYVEDTASSLGILFDIGAPSTVTATDNGLTIGNAPLLVSPEFAQTLLTLSLASSNLTGAQVGSAQVSGFSTPAVGEKIVVSGTGLSPVSFPASSVTNVDVALSRGVSSLSIGQLDLQGALDINANAIFDRVSIRSTSADSLTLNGQNASSLGLAVTYSTFVNTSVNAPTSFFSASTVTLNTDLLSGNVLFDGGAGFDSLSASDAPISEKSIVNFTTVDNNGTFHHRQW